MIENERIVCCGVLSNRESKKRNKIELKSKKVLAGKMKKAFAAIERLFLSS